MSLSTADIPQRLRLLESLGGVAWQDWIWSAGLLVLALGLGFGLARLGLALSKRWAKQTAITTDDLMVKSLSGPIKLLAPTLLVRIAVGAVTLPDSVVVGLGHALTIIVICGVGWVAVRALTILEGAIYERSNAQTGDDSNARTIRTQVQALRNVAVFVVITVTISSALMTFDTVRQLGAGLLASAGLAGIVVGFAAQRSLGTLVAGIQIALAQPVRVDDVVVVEGEWGRVEEITLTYVVIRIWDLRRLIVPITYFIEKPFQNWTRTSTELLGTVELQLDYCIPIEDLRAELERIVRASPNWDQKTAKIQITATGERTMTVRPLVSASDASQLWDLRCEVREKLIDFVHRRYPAGLPRQRTDTFPQSLVSG